MFNNYSKYYDLIYQDKNYKKETNYILNLLKKYKIFHGNLLEFGSGTGKHGYLLAEKGYNVIGIELSAGMVSKSKTHPKFTCKQGDITKIKVKKSFDVVFSLFHVMSYQTGNDQIKAVFNNVSKHLKKGGLFIFDFWYSPAVYHLKPSLRVKRFQNKQFKIVRVAEPENLTSRNLVNINFTFFINDLVKDTQVSFEETHTMRHFSLPEIDFLAEINGLKRIESHEFLSKKKPSEETWGVCAILKK